MWLPTGVVGHQLLQAVELGAGGDVEAATVQLADLVVLHVEPLGVVEVGHGEAIGTCGQDRGAEGDVPWMGAPHGVPLRVGTGEAGLGMEVLLSPKSRGWGAAPGCTSWLQVPGRNGTAMPHHHNLQLPSACTAALPSLATSHPTGCANKGRGAGRGELLTNNSPASQRGAKGLVGPIPSSTNPTMDIASGAWLCSAHMRTRWCCWGHR